MNYIAYTTKYLSLSLRVAVFTLAVCLRGQDFAPAVEGIVTPAGPAPLEGKQRRFESPLPNSAAVVSYCRGA